VNPQLTTVTLNGRLELLHSHPRYGKPPTFIPGAA
jgi:hypothetical protein